MLEQRCSHCDKRLALYWVAFADPPAVRFAWPLGFYPPGSGVMVWARTVDDAYNAVLGQGKDLSHPVTVCPHSEFIALVNAGAFDRPLTDPEP